MRMNERIKLLAEQCYEDSSTQIDVYKFAELIVEHCVQQVKEQYLPVLEDELMMKDTHWDGYVQCGVDSVVGIREYFFGVEE
jgi:hypothetical protein